MKWRVLGGVLAAASRFQHEPERSALADLANELDELERSSSRSPPYERAPPGTASSR